jgi:hypothetical protein
MAKCKSEKSISPGERQLVGARGLRNQIQGIRGKIRNVYATVAADLGSSRKVSRSGDDLFQVQHPCVLTEVSLLELLTQRQCPAAGDGLAKAFAKNRKFGSLTGTRAAFPGCRGGWFRAASSWGGLALVWRRLAFRTGLGLPARREHCACCSAKPSPAGAE